MHHKALSVQQPWASLLVSGAKTIELRTWSTSHRGPLVICAGLKRDPRGERHPDGPRGVALGLVSVLDVRPATIDDANASGLTREQMQHALDLARARGRVLFAWLVDDARALASLVLVSGRLSLFDVDLP